MRLSSMTRRLMSCLLLLVSLRASPAWAQPIFSGPTGSPEETFLRFGRVTFTLPGRWHQKVVHGGVVLMVWPVHRTDFAVWIYRDTPLGGLPLKGHLARVRASYERGRTVDAEGSMDAPKTWKTDGGVRAAFQWRVTRVGGGGKTHQSYVAFDRGDRVQVVVLNAYNSKAEKAFGKMVGVALRGVKPMEKR